MLPRESYEVFQKNIFAEYFWVTTFGFRQRFILCVSNSCLELSKRVVSKFQR